MPKIGVILDEKKEITSLFDGDNIVIYEKKKGSWIVSYEVKNTFQQMESIQKMRETIQELILNLGECKILVASLLTGIAFSVLDKEGFLLCEANEISNQLFEEISYDFAMLEQEKQRRRVSEEVKTKPYETKDSGIFELDLRKMQECHPEISSKMAILPFLKEETFYKLRLYCEHVMPWLEHHHAMTNYQYKASKLEGSGYLVCITKKTCV